MFTEPVEVTPKPSVLAYIPTPRPDHTTIFCWLGWLGRKLGWKVRLLYAPTYYQEVWCEVENSFLYPLTLLSLRTTDFSTLSADWYVFFFSYGEYYSDFKSLPPPRRGAILLIASSAFKEECMYFLEVWKKQWGSVLISTFNLEKEPNAPFCCMPPEAVMCSRPKIKNAVLVTTTEYDCSTTPPFIIEDLCNKLSDAQLWAVALDYKKERDDSGFPVTATPLGFASFLSTFKWWVHIAPTGFVGVPITSSANFEVLLAKACGVHLITNLVLPPSMRELPHVHRVPTITPESVLQKIKELEDVDVGGNTFDGVLEEVKMGQKLILESLGVGNDVG